MRGAGGQPRRRGGHSRRRSGGSSCVRSAHGPPTAARRRGTSHSPWRRRTLRAGWLNQVRTRNCHFFLKCPFGMTLLCFTMVPRPVLRLLSAMWRGVGAQGRRGGLGRLPGRRCCSRTRAPQAAGGCQAGPEATHRLPGGPDQKEGGLGSARRQRRRRAGSLAGAVAAGRRAQALWGSPRGAQQGPSSGGTRCAPLHRGCAGWQCPCGRQVNCGRAACCVLRSTASRGTCRQLPPAASGRHPGAASSRDMRATALLGRDCSSEPDAARPVVKHAHSGRCHRHCAATSTPLLRSAPCCCRHEGTIGAATTLLLGAGRAWQS